MRKLIIFILPLLLIFAAQRALALRIGDIEVYSALNQPLEAEIILVSDKPGETEGMIIALASDSAFEQGGVPRLFHLTKLKFQLTNKPDGTQIIKVTTRNPVREPFLDFLVDIDWPSGRTIKKFTILLDPPVYATRTQTTTKAPDSVLGGTTSGDTVFSQTAEDETFFADETPSTVGEPSLIQRDQTGETSSADTSDTSVFVAGDESLQDEPFEDEALDFSADDEESLLELADAGELADLPAEDELVEDFTADKAEATDDFALDDTSDADTFGEDLSDLGDDESLAELGGSVFDDDTDFEAAETEAAETELAEVEDALFEEGLTDESDDTVLFDDEGSEEVEFDDFASDDSEVDVFEDSEDVAAYDESVAQDSYADDSFVGLTSSSQYSIPDIDVTLDESIPYDIEKTQALLAEFATEDGSKRLIPEGDYEVLEGDYLHKIASSYAPAGVSINQAMLAILRHNPDAFIRDNINNIKKGAVLRIPDQQEMMALNDAAALGEVQRQNGLWREYKEQLAGTASTSEYADSEYATDSSVVDSSLSDSSSTTLSIIAPGKDDDAGQRVSGQQDGTDDGTSADTNLLLAQEALEAERLEKLELQDRLKDLEEQVSMMQRLITLKDQQYAELQAQLGGGETATTTTTVATLDDSFSSDSEVIDDASDDSVDALVDDAGETLLSTADGDAVADISDPLNDALQTQLDNALTIDDSLAQDDQGSEEPVETSVDDTAAAEETGTTETAAVDDLLTDDTDSPTLEDVSGDDDDLLADTGEEATASDQAEETVSVPPLAKEETYLSFLYEFIPKPYSTMLEDFLSQPYGLPALIALPFLIVIGIFLVLRKFSKGSVKEKSIFLHEPPQDEHDAAVDDDLLHIADESFEQAAEEPVAEQEFNPERTQTINEAVQEAALETQEASAESAPAAVPEEDEPMDDTTAEADVYLAYGLFDQAEDLLKQALASNPDRHEYRGKLLETYFAEGKRQEFEALAGELKAALGGGGGRLWDKAIAMGKEIAPDSDLFTGAAGSDLKASDFAPAKPQATDIELGGETTTTTDVDLAVGGTEPETDFDLGIGDEAPQQMADTVISPADTVSADDQAAVISDTELEFDLSEADDLVAGVEDLDAGLDLDFNADDLGLGTGDVPDADIETILEAPDDDEPVLASEPEPVVKAHAEETVALDMDMNLDELDLGDIGDTDDTDFDLDDFADSVTDDSTASSAADELLAEIDAADLDLTMPGEGAEPGEDTIIEDEDESDETIITADIDFDETFTGDSTDDDISMDEVNTKLDLARAYIDMGDNDGASSTLNEVIAEGSDKQRKEAKSLLAQIG